jgi:hypothetical protein
MKIARDPRDSTGKQFIYYVELNGQFHRFSCEGHTTKLPFEKRNGEKLQIDTLDVVDLVPRVSVQ